MTLLEFEITLSDGVKFKAHHWCRRDKYDYESIEWWNYSRESLINRYKVISIKWIGDGAYDGDGINSDIVADIYGDIDDKLNPF